MGDALEVDWEGGQRNFSLHAKHENNVYVRFSAQPNFDGQSWFMA